MNSPNSPVNAPGALQVTPNDIEELIPYVVPWWQYVVVVGIVLAVIAAAIALWYWLKHRKKEEKPVFVDHWANLSAGLQNLNPDKMLADLLAKELYFQFSLILRTGIELATQIRATDMTYPELAPLMEKKLRVKGEELAAMQDFLKTADLVKFADRPATLGEAAHFKQQLMIWITMLKPRQELGLPADNLQTVVAAPSVVNASGPAPAKGFQG